MIFIGGCIFWENELTSKGSMLTPGPIPFQLGLFANGELPFGFPFTPIKNVYHTLKKAKHISPAALGSCNASAARTAQPNIAALKLSNSRSKSCRARRYLGAEAFQQENPVSVVHF